MVLDRRIFQVCAKRRLGALCSQSLRPTGKPVSSLYWKSVQIRQLKSSSTESQASEAAAAYGRDAPTQPYEIQSIWSTTHHGNVPRSFGPSARDPRLHNQSSTNNQPDHNKASTPTYTFQSSTFLSPQEARERELAKERQTKSRQVATTNADTATSTSAKTYQFSPGFVDPRDIRAREAGYTQRGQYGELKKTTSSRSGPGTRRLQSNPGRSEQFNPQVTSSWAHLNRRSTNREVPMNKESVHSASEVVPEMKQTAVDPLSILSSRSRKGSSGLNIQDILKSQESGQRRVGSDRKRTASGNKLDTLLKKDISLPKAHGNAFSAKEGSIRSPSEQIARIIPSHAPSIKKVTSEWGTFGGEAPKVDMDEKDSNPMQFDQSNNEPQYDVNEALLADMEPETSWAKSGKQKMKGKKARAEAFEDGTPTQARMNRRTSYMDEDGDYERSIGKKRHIGRERDTEFDEDEFDLYEEEEEFTRKRRPRKNKVKEKKKQAAVPIELPEYISVANLAKALNVRYKEFVLKMEDLGFEDVQNDHILDAENSALVAMEYNYEPRIAASPEEYDLVAAPVPEDTSALPQRPPVVTIMGHVDHGKTTILDFLRNSSVVASEFGGITQHIGAFSVPLASGKTITFLDTPGHAAFLSMRQRGANMTDIVVLVVAADDGVKPQTIEAIRHAQAAKVPIIVAINKMDKEDAAPERVKTELARQGVDVEDFGGDTQVVCVSGKTGLGMADLEESVITLSEILDHRADDTGVVEGWVVEATTKKSGRVATVLVRRGTLKPGDIVVAGSTWARVRSLRNEAGVAVASAGPGSPVEVDGWREQPSAGAEVLQAIDEQKATSVVEYRIEKEESERLSKDMEAINETRRQEAERRAREKKEAAQGESGESQEQVHEVESGYITVPLIIKADVSGSSEAVQDAIAAIGNSEVGSLILRSGVGPVSEFDVEHAAAAGGHILSFNVEPEGKITQLAESKNVKILSENIIYRLVDQVKSLLSAKLSPLVTRKVTGEAEISMLFSINLGGKKQMAVAGCKVRNGVITRGSKVKVTRGTEVVYDGVLTSLKNVKKDVTEMRKGTECGMSFEEWEGFQPGDQIQCYEERSEKRHL